METHEVMIARSLKRPLLAWCSLCGCEAAMESPEAIAQIVGVSARTIYRWVEAGKVHFTETPSGSLLICLNSLPGETRAGRSRGSTPGGKTAGGQE